MKSGSRVHVDGAVGEHGLAGRQRAVAGLGQQPPVLSLDSATFGWSNGLMPSSRPATAMAYSQTRNWAPSGPETDGVHRPGRVAQGDQVRRRGLARSPARPRRSTTTGRIPRPSLPVDSAISCSAQSPKPGEPGAAVGQHDLVVPGQRVAAQRGAQREARVVRQSPASAGSHAVGLVEQPGHVHARQRRGHQAERGQRAVPAAHVRVGEHDVVAGLVRRSSPAAIPGR